MGASDCTRLLWVTIEDFIYAVGLLAVAILEGLPLALTISLVFSSNELSNGAKLVKTVAKVSAAAVVRTSGV